MDQLAIDLYRSSCKHFLGNVIPSSNISSDRSGMYVFRDDLQVQENTECTVFGKLHRGMSIALHLLRPEYKRTGWFKLTSAFPFGLASVLFDNQVRVLRDIIQQESDNDVRHVRWLTGDADDEILVYVDFNSLVPLILHRKSYVHADISFRTCIRTAGTDKGRVGRSVIETPELLLKRIGDKYVTINLNLTRVPNLVPKIEGFIARATRVEIHGAETV